MELQNVPLRSGIMKAELKDTYELRVRVIVFVSEHSGFQHFAGRIRAVVKNAMLNNFLSNMSLGSAERNCLQNINHSVFMYILHFGFVEHL